MPSPPTAARGFEGYNNYGQLGRGGTGGTYNSPQQLLAPSGYKFTSIDADANSWHAVATLAAVPEPASLSFLAVGGATVLARRRRTVCCV